MMAVVMVVFGFVRGPMLGFLRAVPREVYYALAALGLLWLAYHEGDIRRGGRDASRYAAQAAQVARQRAAHVAVAEQAGTAAIASVDAVEAHAIANAIAKEKAIAPANPRCVDDSRLRDIAQADHDAIVAAHGGNGALRDSRIAR